MAVTKDELRSFLGEGFHTAFRKAADSDEANTIWHLIQKMDPDEWHAVLDFVTEPTFEMLQREGVQSDGAASA